MEGSDTGHLTVDAIESVNAGMSGEHAALRMFEDLRFGFTKLSLDDDVGKCNEFLKVVGQSLTVLEIDFIDHRAGEYVSFSLYRPHNHCMILTSSHLPRSSTYHSAPCSQT